MVREIKKTTKDTIISTARSLFAEKGYDQISMRDVASALSISVGNLTYHFNKKEDLLEAVVMSFFNDYQPISPCHTLQEVDSLLQQFERIREEHLFYFGNYSQLSIVSEKICRIQHQVYLDNAQTWHDTFSILCNLELVKPEGFQGQFVEVGNALHFMKVHWNLRQEAEQRMNIPVSSFRNAAWMLIFPLLTDKGCTILQNEIESIDI